jgi:hypothetical protein
VSAGPAKPQPGKVAPVAASDRTKPQVVGGTADQAGDTARGPSRSQVSTGSGATNRTEPPAKVPPRPETTQPGRGRGTPGSPQKPEARIFVAPRAPDDPGPDDDAADKRAVANGAPIRT